VAARGEALSSFGDSILAGGAGGEESRGGEGRRGAQGGARFLRVAAGASAQAALKFRFFVHLPEGRSGNSAAWGRGGALATKGTDAFLGFCF